MAGPKGRGFQEHSLGGDLRLEVIKTCVRIGSAEKSVTVRDTVKQERLSG